MTQTQLAWLAVIDRVRVFLEMQGWFDRWQCCNQLRMGSIDVDNGQNIGIKIHCCPRCHEPSFSPGKYGQFPQ